MKLQAHRIRHAIRIVILLGTASAAALANQSPTLVSVPRTPMCYCQCEHGAGAKQCRKMCELPKFENRWWATSCHKKSSFAKESELQDSKSNSHSRKTNRTEEARR
jgi:hypothetical protein